MLQTDSSRMSLMEADSVLESLWDQDAVAWDRHWVPIFRLFALDLVEDACPLPGDLVLDLGTGSGVAALEVRKATPSVSLVAGIDRSDAMIRLARRRAKREDLKNVRFIRMNGEGLHFPDGFFDVAISNCGIGVADFSRGLKEILRVLRPGGVLAFNDWHLMDVQPHRIFGEVLRKYRTAKPSPELLRERLALATMESFHHSLNSQTQLKMVIEAGFRNARLTNRRHKVRMKGTKDYLRTRLCRATIRRELSEIPPTQCKLFLAELKERLIEFVKGDGFVFDWNVFYIRAKKPS